MADFPEGLQRLLEFLGQLRDHEIGFRLSAPRREAIMVEVALPRERWEIEFFDDGHVETDRFIGSEGVQSGPGLRDFWSTVSGD